MLQLIQLHLLLLNLQSFFSHKLVLLIYPAKTDAVSFLFRFVLLYDFVELLCQLINLGLQFDVLLNQSFFLVLLG